MRAPVRIGLLGPLEVVRDGARVEPTSPKQRALLIDLAIRRGETVGRDRLIDDLWGAQPPATAAGVLQNYVSQIRRALGADAVRTEGPGYAIAAEVTTDVAELEGHLARAWAARDEGDAVTVGRATADAVALWRGHPLADVAFEPFAQAEIARLMELRAVALELQLEAEIAGGRSQAAVASLEAAVSDHPGRERLWWLLMLAQQRSGRQADALRTYQRARDRLGEELGLEPGRELRELERAILDQAPELDRLLVTPARRRRSRPRARSSLLGRQDEWAAIERFIGHGRGLLLLVGEPGIGKTRLLEEAQARVESEDGVTIVARGFEAERGRPYGAWVDALRAVDLPGLDRTVRTALGPLMPELADEPAELDEPNRLYDAVVGVLELLARDAPVAVLVDDLHWLDESSVALLHHAVRRLGDTGVSFLATARRAELDDDACGRVLRALRRDDALEWLSVGPLPAATIAELTEAIAPDADSRRIAEATNGNPLFALEMARALARGDEPLSSRIDMLIGDRLARLDERATALVPWIAAFGRRVSPMVLARLVERDPAELFEPLGDLERHGIVHALEDGTVDFAHDLVRTAAYKRLSTPRRTMLHARIGAVLTALADPDDSFAADAVRHADLGEDDATCAAACLRAARRCLRLVAYADADEMVALGRSHARRLPAADRLPAELDLIGVLLHPGVRLHDPGELARDLAELSAEAQRLGLDRELSRGLSLLARAYHWGWGDIPRARALMQRATRLMESAATPDLEPLLEGARCLAYLEVDMDRTAQLFDELASLHVLAAESVQYQWGLGLVHAWRGDLEAARAALGRAIEISNRRADHWIAFECSARLALLEIEAGDPNAADATCRAITQLAHRLGEGSEQPYAAAIVALCALAHGDPDAHASLDAAIATLDRIDATFLVPDLLGIAGELHHRAGDVEPAVLRAEWALRVAGEVARPVESARGHALLACIAAERGDHPTARAHLAAIDESASGIPHHVEALRRTGERLVAAGHPNDGGERWP